MTDNQSAKRSWEMVERFYRSVRGPYGGDYTGIESVIEHVRQNGLDDVLFGSTSHEFLLISSQRDCSTKDSIRIGQEGGVVRFEFFDSTIGHYETVGEAEVGQMADLVRDCLSRITCV